MQCAVLDRFGVREAVRVVLLPNPKREGPAGRQNYYFFPTLRRLTMNTFEYFSGELDYLSTGRLVTTYPDGLDTEVFTKAALLRAADEAKLPSEHEHVTPYIWNHPELFRIATLEYERDLSTLRWTVDESRDLEFVRAVYHELAGRDVFPMNDVLGVLTKKPELGNINSDITRNSGYYKSLREERGA
jgi:spore coat polysaccharide biosynthesis protein SpsF